LLDISSLERNIKDIEIVYHLAAEMNFFPKDTNEKNRIYQVNVEGTRNLLKVCKGIKRFIYSSSVTVIGPTNGVANENHECQPEYDYGSSKFATENLIKESGLPYLILRITGIYGPRDTFVIYELMQMVNQGIMFFIPGNGKRKLSFSYVDDVVDALCLAATNGVVNSLYIIGCEALSFREWIDEIAEALGRAKPIIHLPIPLCKVVINIISPIMNFGKKRTFMYHSETLERMLEDHEYVSTKVLTELQWKPKHTIKQGIRLTSKYYLETGQLYSSYFSPVFLTLSGLLLLIYLWNSFK